MKVSISHYEGQKDFVEFSSSMPDDITISDFIDNLEVVVRAIYGQHIILDYKDAK